MKKLATITALAAVLALGSAGLYARGGGPGFDGHGTGYGPFMISEELKLTDEQADRIHKINMEYREKAWKDRVEHRKAIDKVLTDEQKKKLAEMKKKRPEKRADRKGRHHDKKGHIEGPGHMGFIYAELELTDDQMDKIHRINMEYADRFHKNRNNPDGIKKLRDSREKDIEKIMTKEQLKKIKEFREKRGCPYFPED